MTDPKADTGALSDDDWEHGTIEQHAEIMNLDGPLSRGHLHPWDFYKRLRDLQPPCTTSTPPISAGADAGLSEQAFRPCWLHLDEPPRWEFVAEDCPYVVEPVDERIELFVRMSDRQPIGVRIWDAARASTASLEALREALTKARDRFFPADQPESEQDLLWDEVNAALAKPDAEPPAVADAAEGEVPPSSTGEPT